MKNLFVFENMKFWRSSKTPVVMLFLVVALIGMFLFNTVKDKTYWDEEVLKLEIERTVIWNERVNIRDHLLHIRRSTPDDKEAIAAVSNLQEAFKTQYLLSVRQLTMARDYRNGLCTIRDVVELAIVRDQHLLEVLEAGHKFLNEEPGTVRQRLLINQNLINEEIEPLNSPYEMTASNFVYQLTSYPWILIILVSLSLLAIDMFSGDAESGTYKVLYSQPVSRGRIHAVKFLVNFANSFIVVSGLVVLVFGLVALVNGLGDTAYPTFYYSESYQNVTTVASSGTSADTLTFLSWSSYILRTLPLYCLLCCFVVSLIGTASLLLNNTANVLNGLFCLLVLDYPFRFVFSSESVFYIFWPLTAAGLNNVLQGVYFLSAGGYLFVLAIFSVLLIAFSLLILKKRQMTGGISS